MTDQDIIQLIRERKHSPALDQLYRHFDAIRAMVTSYGGSNEDARDIFQQGLMVFCEHAQQPDFQIRNTVEGFLYGTCRYLWINTLRKRKKKRALDLEDEVDPSTTDLLVSYLEKEAKLQAMDQILAALGEKCRKLLELCYFHKYSMKQIAQMLGYQNENTAKTRKYKCMEQARKMAQKHPVSLQTSEV